MPILDMDHPFKEKNLPIHPNHSPQTVRMYTKCTGMSKILYVGKTEITECGDQVYGTCTHSVSIPLGSIVEMTITVELELFL